MFYHLLLLGSGSSHGALMNKRKSCSQGERYEGMDALPLSRARFLINERKLAHNITELPSVNDRSITVGNVSNRPARDIRAPLLFLFLFYGKRSFPTNSAQERSIRKRSSSSKVESIKESCSSLWSGQSIPG